MDDWVTAALIVVGVVLLACVRAWWWVRKERVLRRVGRDLHVDESHQNGR